MVGLAGREGVGVLIRSVYAFVSVFYRLNSLFEIKTAFMFFLGCKGSLIQFSKFLVGTYFVQHMPLHQ